MTLIDPYGPGGLRVWDDYQFRSRRRTAAQPTIHIMSPDVVTAWENAPLRHYLLTNWKDADRFTWTIIGGPDAGRFEVVQGHPWYLRWTGDVTKNFEQPDDANGDGTYEVSLKVTDSLGFYGTDTQQLRVILGDIPGEIIIIPPANEVPPVVTGPAVIGGELSSTPGTWSGTNPVLTYQWYSITVVAPSNLLLVAGGELLLHNAIDLLLLAAGGPPVGAPIPGAIGPTYTIPPGSSGKSFYCVVTATNPAGTVSATSNIVGPVP